MPGAFRDLPRPLRDALEVGGRHRPRREDVMDHRFLCRPAFDAVLSAIDTWTGPGRDEALAVTGRSLDSWPDTRRSELAQGEGMLDALLTSPSWPLVRSLEVWLDDLDAVARLAQRPELATLRALDLEVDEPLDPVTLHRLLGSPHLAGLRSLRLGQHYLRDPAAEALARIPLIGELESLSLPDGAELLLASGKLNKLLHLELYGGAEAARLLDRRFPPSVRRLTVCDLENQGGAAFLAASPALGQVRDLELTGSENGADAAVALAENPHLGKLERLAMRGASPWIGTEGFHALGHAAFLENLTDLELDFNPVGDAGWEALATWPLHRLRRLSLNHTTGGDSGLAALAASPYLRHIEELFLGSNRVGPIGLSALANAPWLSGLRILDLEMNPVEDPAPLVGSASSANLTFLSAGEVYAHGLMAIAASPYLGQLEYLGVGCHGLDPGCIAALGRSAAGASLTGLLLAYSFDDRCARAMADSPGFSRLRSLRPFGDLTADGLASLANSSHLAGLWVLHLGLQQFGDAGATRLAESTTLRTLTDLDLFGCRVSDVGSTSLARSPVSRTLRKVRLDDAGMPAWAIEPRILPVLRARVARQLEHRPDPW